MDKYDFYLIVAPGLSDLAAEELRAKWLKLSALARNFVPQLQEVPLEIEEGDEGITIVQIPLVLGVLLNVYLKIPTRILVRVKTFRCRDFPKLYNKCKKIDWKPWFKDKAIKVKVSAKRSRLMMLKRIEETVLKGISIDSGVDTKQTLFVRFEDDTCTLSVDTSGVPLYMRTPDKKVGEAPIRETLAAALVYELKKHCHSEPITLIDPMAGSGTVLREALTFWNTHSRFDYSFSNFSGLDKIDILSLCEKKLEQATWENIIGYDKSEKAVKAAAANLGSEIVVSKRDLFVKTTPPSCNIAIFVNPPYGERLKLKEDRKVYFAKLWKAIVASYSPKIAGIIIPRNLKKTFFVDKPYKVVANRDFLNGGLKVTFVIVALS